MFKLTLDYDTASDAEEIADLIDRVADEIRRGMLRGYVRDVDLDAVGHFELSD